MSIARQDFIMAAGKAKSISFNVPSAIFTLKEVTLKISDSPNGVALVTKTKSGGDITLTSDEECTVNIDAGDITEPGLYYYVLSSPNALDIDVELAFGRCFCRPIAQT